MLKALFKINIDIAHREYYLKVDIPEKSDWWYGYESDGKLVSFEPTVEYKFSNFHALNQVENGKLLCTVKGDNAKDAELGLWITPINRELLEDARTNHAAIHYNDLWYWYDYAKTLNGVVDSNSNDLNPFAKTNDRTYYYSVNPLYLYENTSIQSPTNPNGFVKHKLGLPNNRPVQR